MLWVEAICPTQAVPSCGGNVEFQQAVVVWRAPDGEPFVAMWRECVAVVGVYPRWTGLSVQIFIFNLLDSFK